MPKYRPTHYRDQLADVPQILDEVHRLSQFHPDQEPSAELAEANRRQIELAMATLRGRHLARLRGAAAAMQPAAETQEADDA